MAISRKRKRTIRVGGSEFLWWVAESKNEWECYPECLYVASPDGRFFLHRRKSGGHVAGRWLFGEDSVQGAFECPLRHPESITPGYIEELIRWATEDGPHARVAQQAIEVLALDLEGTLVSNAMSQFPRAGLNDFLEKCQELIPRVVIYTAVREEVFRRVAKQLVKDRLAPEWFAEVEYINWSGDHKDLDLIPGCDSRFAWLVDDNEDYVKPGQEDRWIKIPSWKTPYEPDLVLKRAQDMIEAIVLYRAVGPINPDTP